MNRLLGFVAAVLLGCSSLGHAQGAQDYPSRPIRFIVTYTPAGAADYIAREIAQRLGALLGQPVVVENRPGANGNIGLEAAARAAPDGYTVVLAASPVVVSPVIYKQLPFDVVEDFAHITVIADTPMILVSTKDLPAGNLQEMIALSKAKPKTLSFGSGSPLHLLASELINTRAGLDLLAVNYRGVAEARADVMTGRISMMTDSIGATLPYIKQGQLKPIGVLGAKRSALLPEVPTLMESGLAGYDVAGWVGLMAPARTPQPILDRLHSEMMKVLNAPDLQEKFANAGYLVAPGTHSVMKERIKREIAAYKEAAKQAKLELQ